MSSAVETYSATSVASFVNSVGVNTHEGYTNTPYANSNQVIADLNYLGINRVRDGVAIAPWQAKGITALAAAGIKVDFVINAVGSSVDVAGNVAALDAFEKLYPGSITSVEGPNEVGLAPVPFNGGTSLDDEIALQSALYHAVHDDAALAGIPVLNLTLGTPTTAAYAQLGDMSGVADMGNAHIYAPYGQAPIYDWSSSLALESTPTAQEATVITEAGYSTLPSAASGVDAAVQAKYTLNLLMDAARSGVDIYLYNLLDYLPDSSGNNINEHYGLFNYDGTAKPAATAIHNLFAILEASSATGATGASAANSLAYAVDNLPATGGAHLFQRADGVFDLALWAEPTIWNWTTHSEAAAPAQGVVVTFASSLQQVRVYDPLMGTAPIATYTNVSSITVSLCDHPLIIETSGVAAATVSGPQILSVADFLAQTGSLAYGANGVVVRDTAAAITANFDALAVPTVTAIQINDGGGVNVSVAQLANGAAAAGKLETAAGASVQVGVIDTLTNVRHGFSVLLADLPQIGSLQIVNGPWTMSVSQFLANPALYAKIAGGVALSDFAANIQSALSSLQTYSGAIASIKPSGAVTVTAAAFCASTAIVSKIARGVIVADSAQNLQGVFDALAQNAGAIAAIRSTTGVVQLSATAFQNDAAALAKLSGKVTVADAARQIVGALGALVAGVKSIASVSVAQGALSVGVSVFQNAKALLDKINGGFAIVDSEADIQAHLSALRADVCHIRSITVGSATASSVTGATQGGNVFGASPPAGAAPVQFALSASQYASAQALLPLISNAYVASVTQANGAQLLLGHGDGLALDIAGGAPMTTATGGGSQARFTLASRFGHATLTDFGAHAFGPGADHISLGVVDFSSWAALVGDAHASGGGTSTTFSSTTTHSTLTLKDVAFSTFSSAPGAYRGDFSFHA